MLENIKNHLDAPNVVSRAPGRAPQGVGGDPKPTLAHTSLDSLRPCMLVSRELLRSERETFKNHLDTFGRVLRDCHFSNPRKIKRILNRYILFLSRDFDDLHRFYMDNVVKLLVIAEYFPMCFVT
ncbi:MAG: hypothetical protein IPK19_01630 [Chloroflexi bacterium]|nr:hypothetical protein [Chloroflexota bacterium]